MADWRDIILQFTSDVEDYYDKLRFRLNKRIGGIGPVDILTYLGHGTRNRLYIRGRVLENNRVSEAQDNDTLWKNLLNMYRRLNSHEIPNARVRVQFDGFDEVVTADVEGFFDVTIEPEEPLPPEQLWHEVKVELVDYADQEGSEAYVLALVPPEDAQFGIISDLDDTVLQTEVSNIIKLARNTFLNNARTRLPFAGVAEFYSALQRGTAGTYNPIYYVSNGPWNLYDLLVDFFEVRHIPMGPLFLLELGLTEEHLIRPGGFEHKLGSIEEILNTHPDLSFILIGDSGEKDPEIYHQAVKNHPGRIQTIYIRDVSSDERDSEIQALAEELEALGSQMILVPDTVAAAIHAVERGYIEASALPEIRKERRQDAREPDTVEKLIDAMP